MDPDIVNEIDRPPSSSKTERQMKDLDSDVHTDAPLGETPKNFQFTKGHGNSLFRHSGENRNPGFSDETLPKDPHEIYKIAIIIILLSIACFFTYYFHVVLGIEIIFTHFFYLPVILASLWWGKKGLVVAVFLSAMLVLSHFFLRPNLRILEDGLRAGMLMIVATIISVLSERIASTEKKLRQHQEKLLISERNIKKFSQQILSIREEEKKKLSIDLHDELGSMAIALSSSLSISEEEIKENNQAGALKCIRDTRSALKKAINNLKMIAVDQMPPNLEIIGLHNALEEYVSRINKQTKVSINLDTNLDSLKIKDNIAIAIYRIVQEALNNILIHANARTVFITLYYKSGTIAKDIKYPEDVIENHDGVKKSKVNAVYPKGIIRLNISDDGRGFDVNKGLQQQGERFKIGIHGMKQRVESLGGVFIIKSEPKKGSEIDINIPV
ncbi:sensor histidine kinase [bacterium]|nr:sensor histidine kinase [bacterium]